MSAVRLRVLRVLGVLRVLRGVSRQHGEGDGGAGALDERDHLRVRQVAHWQVVDGDYSVAHVQATAARGGRVGN